MSDDRAKAIKVAKQIRLDQERFGYHPSCDGDHAILAYAFLAEVEARDDLEGYEEAAQEFFNRMLDAEARVKELATLEVARNNAASFYRSANEHEDVSHKLLDRAKAAEAKLYLCICTLKTVVHPIGFKAMENRLMLLDILNLQAQSARACLAELKVGK